MRAMHPTGQWRRAAIVCGGFGTLLLALGCSAVPGSGVASQAAQPQTAQQQELMAGANQTGLPVVVSCEPGQRTIVKPTIVNGVAMSQVECVAAAVSQPVAYAQPLVQSRPAATPVVYRPPAPTQVVREVADTEVVPVSNRLAVRPASGRQVVYDEPRVQRRTVKKSAIIIGSSSGVGAGVGAAVGGKKGALIGAVIGGGGAALWDQVTRRKN
jgi:hypothetical protein